MSHSQTFYPVPSGRHYAPVYKDELDHHPRASDRMVIALLLLIVVAVIGAAFVIPRPVLMIVAALAIGATGRLVLRVRFHR